MCFVNRVLAKSSIIAASIGPANERANGRCAHRVIFGWSVALDV
jgi:hypothetical protein